MNKSLYIIVSIILFNATASASIFSSFSQKKKTSPENKTSTSLILLWIPSKDTPLGDILDKLEQNPNLKINTALFKSTDTLTMQRLKKLSKEGRIETTMRLTNDPVIGLFYYPKNVSRNNFKANKSTLLRNNPFFFAQRFTDGRQVFMEEIKTIPEGFTNTPGDIFPDYIPLAKSIELKWIATGPLLSTSSYETFNCEGISIVPFELLKSSSDFTLKKEGLQFIVYDETISTKTSVSSSGLLLDFLEENRERQYLTVKEALKMAISTSVSRNHITGLTAPWSGNYSLWSSNRNQKGLLNGMEKTREEILRFMGSNPKNSRKANSILNDFYIIESSEQLLSLREQDGKRSRTIELDLQKKLAKIYRGMNKNLPSWIFKSFKELSPVNTGAEVIISSGASFIELKNAFFDIQKTEPAVESSSATSVRLSEMKIQWTEEEIEFHIIPEIINADAEKETDFDGIDIDIYIDINNRFRAGRTKPLRGTKISISPKDAWEYAISVDADKTVLNYATMSGVKKLSSIETIKENGMFKIVLPRNLLRGNPFRWGYLAILFSDKNSVNFTDKLSSNGKKGYISSIRPGKK